MRLFFTGFPPKSNVFLTVEESVYRLNKNLCNGVFSYVYNIKYFPEIFVPVLEGYKRKRPVNHW